MLPDYITAYLRTQGATDDALADPLATFATLRLDALAPVEMALLIGDANEMEIADIDYERWQTLADVVKVARELAA